MNTQPENRDLRAAISAMTQADRRLTQAAIAREVGMSASALNQWLKGVYMGANDDVEAKLTRWVDAYHARRAVDSALPIAPRWADTPTGARILAALRYAQMAADIAIVYGGAGVGKTHAIRHYQASAPNVWHATMTPASSSVATSLEEIGETLGVRENGGGAARLHRQIVKKLMGTGGLLVVDEAQHLNVAALDQLRSIHDATSVGIAIVGNEKLYASMTGGNRAPYLDRLFSRIGKRVRVMRSTDSDIAEMIEAWGIEDAKTRKQLIEIAEQPGALRGLTKVLRLATVQARSEGRGAVNYDDVRGAWRELGGAE